MCRYCTMYKCARIKCICTILKQTEQKVRELCDNIYSYTCLSVSLFVSNKRLNRSGPHLVLDLTWPQGRFMDAENVQNYVQKLLIFENSIIQNLPLGHAKSHKTFGPDRFSCFDVYWIQTERQTNRQAKYIFSFVSILQL